MKKCILIIVLFMTPLLYPKKACAIFDPMATVETALELKDEVVTKVQEVQKFKNDLEKRYKQGYALATSCFKDPKNCGLKGIESISKDGITSIKMFPMMPGALDSLDKDITKIKSEDVSNVIHLTYTYVQGDDSLKNTRENRANIGSVVANQAAILFAKGAMIKTRLQKEEDSEIYEDSSKYDQVDSIKYLQSKLDIMNNTRLAHILELKAYMLNAQFTAEMTQQNIKKGEDE